VLLTVPNILCNNIMLRKSYVPRQQFCTWCLRNTAMELQCHRNILLLNVILNALIVILHYLYSQWHNNIFIKCIQLLFIIYFLGYYYISIERFFFAINFIVRIIVLVLIQLIKLDIKLPNLRRFFYIDRLKLLSDFYTTNNKSL
jgi:hypothetical protein